MNFIKHPLEDTLVYEQTLPLAWELFDLATEAAVFATFSRNNENLLKVLLGTDDIGKDHEEGGRETSHELQRIEAKVDLLLQWLGQWVATTQGIPPETAVSFSDAGIKVTLPQTGVVSAIEVGHGVLFHVYLDKHYPQALHLPGEVYAVEQAANQSTIVATFTGLHPDTYDLIEKFIFREHRRKIAASKRNPT